jgi:hypothetical protein
MHRRHAPRQCRHEKADWHHATQISNLNARFLDDIFGSILARLGFHLIVEKPHESETHGMSVLGILSRTCCSAMEHTHAKRIGIIPGNA